MYSLFYEPAMTTAELPLVGSLKFFGFEFEFELLTGLEHYGMGHNGTDNNRTGTY